jgi:hypothetical protein
MKRIMTKWAEYLPCISGARSGRENEPIMMEKKTFITAPGSAEGVYEVGN